MLAPSGPSFPRRNIEAIRQRPGWLQAVVAVNPVSLLVTAIRDIMAGTPVAGAILLALLAPGVIAAMFGPVTMRLYRCER